MYEDLVEMYRQLDALRERKRKGYRLLEKLGDNDVEDRKRYELVMKDLIAKENALVEIVHPLTTEMLKKSNAILPY